MDAKEIDKLLEKHLSGQLSIEEQIKLSEWYRDEASAKKLILEEDELDRTLTETWFSISKNTMPKKQIFNIFWVKIAAAAVVAIASFGTGLVYFKNGFTTQVSSSRFTNDVSPGKTGATLTLSNGNKITLSNAEVGALAEEAGTIVSKSANNELIYSTNKSGNSKIDENILTTSNGETYQLRLPDGTVVWLNSASSLTYPVTLGTHGKRVVKLKGEAYFEVAKDKTHPFSVLTDGQEVKVLGTHFNINSYADEPSVKTTLLEGSVEIISASHTASLNPGQQASNDGKSIQLSTVDADHATDWKDGDFYMDGTSFKSVMRKIARWYNVEVIYQDSFSDDLKSSGWISRKKTLSAVLKSIETSGQAHFRINGQKVYISK